MNTSHLYLVWMVPCITEMTSNYDTSKLMKIYYPMKFLCDASQTFVVRRCLEIGSRAFLNREKAKADAGQESSLDVYEALGYTRCRVRYR